MELCRMWEKYKNHALIWFCSLALVVIPAIGYFSAQAAQPKTVTFILDGESRTVATRADTVDQFLQEQRIAVTEKDSLRPKPEKKIADGDSITLTTSWTIPILVDGEEKLIQTLNRDVESVLRDAKIALGEKDRVVPELGTRLRKDSTIEVKRVVEQIVQVEERVTFQEVRKNDPSLIKGETKVLQNGQEGKAIAHYKLVTENGTEISRELVKRDVVTPKIDRVVAVGTATATATAQMDDASQRVMVASAGMVSRGGKVFRAKQVLNGVTLTAYSAEGGGKPPGSPGYGRTATGVMAQAGHTIAVDPKVIPLGWWVYIEGVGYRRAEDVGGAVRGNKIDVFVNTTQEAIQFGRKRNRTVYIIGPEKP
ncbi:G5 domain-containing protein [Brevibacillus sp. TJ4]|uniref:G5 domain-containing protein n=1 Tax=Brevibacillus sp. TJ4 TaxID=3234853 RepID=UPI0037D09850